MLCWICLLLVACGNSPFQVKNLAKTDIDMVSDAHYREVESLLRKLTVKLYKRNPRELHKGSDPTIEQRVSQIFDVPGRLQFAENPTIINMTSTCSRNLTIKSFITALAISRLRCGGLPEVLMPIIIP